MNLSKKVLGRHDCSLLHCVFKFVITRVHCDFELLRNSRCKNKTIVSLWRTSSTEIITRCFIQTLRKKCPYLEFFRSVLLPLIGLNTEIYPADLRIQSKCGKIRTRETPNKDNFQAVKEPVTNNCYNCRFNSFHANVSVAYPKKCQKIYGLLTFSGGIETEH